MVGAQVIEQPRSEVERWLVETVASQARSAGIGMPEVAIYEAPDVNAFATGMNRDNALVAVSTGLLNGMTRDEAEAVLAHEVSHVAHEAEERVEGAAARGWLGGPQMWGLLVLAAVIIAIIILSN
jgi:Zn-dependent protease with chaperone function